MATALVVLNRRAGSGRAAGLEAALREALKRHHPGVALHAPRSTQEAARLVAAAPRGSRVVVVGGDGSLHQLLPSILAAGHELAVIAAGSGDDSARALGLKGLSGGRALTRALTAPSVAVDIGWVRTEHEERPFFSSLAAGFDAAVAQRAVSGPAWLQGTPRYLLATLRELAALRLYSVQIALDGAPWHDGEVLFASTLNTPSYGGGMPAVPHASVHDGRLDLLLAGRFSRTAALLMLPRLLVGKHLGHRELRCAGFSKLHIDSDSPLPVAADGETLAAARRISVRVGQQVLHVVTGPGALDKP